MLLCCHYVLMTTNSDPVVGNPRYYSPGFIHYFGTFQ